MDCSVSYYQRIVLEANFDAFCDSRYYVWNDDYLFYICTRRGLVISDEKYTPLDAWKSAWEKMQFNTIKYPTQ